MTEPLWLTNARELVGLTEIVGSRNEPKIVEFFKEAGHPEVKDDDTAWCAAFIGAMLCRAGWASSGALNARSYEHYGTKLDKPVPGCITVFQRGNSGWEGHVAFFLRDLGDRIEVLGGNQSNSVSIAREPKSALLAYRWPSVRSIKGTLPAPPGAAPVKKAAGAGGIAGAGAVIVAGGAAAAVQNAATAGEIMGWIFGISLAAIGIGLIVYKHVKGNWPWSSTGEASPELSSLSPPSSAPSSEQLSEAQLALQSVALQDQPSLPPSELMKPRKPSVRRLRKTRTQPRKSAKSRPSAGRKSSSKRKSR